MSHLSHSWVEESIYVHAQRRENPHQLGATVAYLEPLVMALKQSLLLLLLPLLVLLPSSHAGLTVGFYDQTCPVAESIVKLSVASTVIRNPGIAAGLIRMHFHDCFVRGCDGSVLIDSTPNNSAEKSSIPNLSLRGFEVIDRAKSLLELICPNTVSCADILAFAARDSAALVGNINYQVPSGRRDGRVSIENEALANLPPPFFNLTQLIDSFARKNLTQEDMVTLSGAHSIGAAHCAAFTNRLYNFSSTSAVDPTLDPTYATFLQGQCPPNSNFTDPKVLPMDTITPVVLDNMYYVGLLRNLGLFTSDQALLTSSASKQMVVDNVNNPSGWATKFAKSMVKMGNIEVLTGTQGEIRQNCHVINPTAADLLISQVASS
ncbi:peroxidase 5-like [Nymphaea colorata]|nr:peroxidase 5-like [Nymphaea colorata]